MGITGIFPRNSIYIQISTTCPEHFNPFFLIKSVFPDWNTMIKPHKSGLISDAEYTKRYRKKLDGNKEEILKTMKAFDSSQFQGRATIMLCYCKKGNFCHRNILREWINENGIECEEL
jgi:hypothetical protein